MNKKLQKHLDDSKIKYEVVAHRTVYTAYDVAATLHVKLNQVAKSLLVKTNKPLEKNKKPYAIVIVPADRNIDLKKLAHVMTEWARLENKKLSCECYSRIVKVEIPQEAVMKTQFKVKPGAMSAFGSLYKLPVFVDKALKGGVIFSSGSFEESIKMLVTDFIKLEGGALGNFSVVKKIKKNK